MTTSVSTLAIVQERFEKNGVCPFSKHDGSTLFIFVHTIFVISLTCENNYDVHAHHKIILLCSPHRCTTPVTSSHSLLCYELFITSVHETSQELYYFWEHVHHNKIIAIRVLRRQDNDYPCSSNGELLGPSPALYLPSTMPTAPPSPMKQ